MKPAIVDRVWITQDGEVLDIHEMRTTHLFYCLRMLFNHSVPETSAIDGRRYSGPRKWSVHRKRRLVAWLVCELMLRRPLPQWMLEQLEAMNRNYKDLVLKKLYESN